MMFTLSKRSIFINLFQIYLGLCSVGSYYLGFGIELGAVFLAINYLLAFYCVSFNNRNIVNLSSFFLLGFGVLILGRVWSKFILLDMDRFESIFCSEFYFHYCLNLDEISYMYAILNLTLISFSIGQGFYFPSRIRNHLTLFIKKKFLFLLLIYSCSIIVLFNSYDRISTAIHQGYMSLYSSQAESYQTPFHLLFSSIYVSGLAMLFILKDKERKYDYHFRILVSIFIMNMLLSILTGSRASFVNAILLIIWLIYREKTLRFYHYTIIGIFFPLLLGLLNLVASLGGARDFAPTLNIFDSISHTLYDQGGSIMVVNLAFKVEEINILAYLKTIIPGIQILYSYFGVTERYLFDFASSLTYKENPTMYEQGFGIGWSMLSDIYLLSFKIELIYAAVFIVFGAFIKYISEGRNWVGGIQFILVGYMFSVSRNSISPVIFSCVVYIMMSLVFMRLKR